MSKDKMRVDQVDELETVVDEVDQLVSAKTVTVVVMLCYGLEIRGAHKPVLSEVELEGGPNEEEAEALKKGYLQLKG